MECEDQEGALPPNALQHEVIPLSSSLLRVSTPSILPLELSISSQMGSISPSPATLHMNRSYSSVRSKTFPVCVTGDGEGMDPPHYCHHYSLQYGCKGVD